MTGPLPTATARRLTWPQLPRGVREAIEQGLGAPVLAATSQNGGFTDGIAARVQLGDTTKAFVKALATDHELAPDYRTEARTAAALPAEVPASRLRFSLEADGWIVLVYDDVEGRHPDFARPGDLAAALTCVERMTSVLTPNPLPRAVPLTTPLGPLLCGWLTLKEEKAPAGLDPWSARNLDRLADLESHWAEATEGNTLLHADLRHDNMLLTRDGTVLAVDWAWACVGAAWVELVYLLPAVAAAGRDPERIAAAHPLTRRADPSAIDAFVCALAGFYTLSGSLPAPSWSPHIRTHEAWYGRLCRDWLARRTGWS
ncbi:Phosphotransferase enzyme family protein [Streptomyces sp. 2131.1]|uniref:phosphotransferase n=1 Tax=Streptomyces sp. 2131.1 TaxID=1855346 RepID=UPI00089CB26A|nr:phosphotransferase [Streptomyces sp. 2131.1]SEE29373.1 Phosphotransferase enzyme family protein [Streptomyces sp. 2131.1]